MASWSRRIDLATSLSAKLLLDALCRMSQRVFRDHEFARQIDEGLDFRLADAEHAIGRSFGCCRGDAGR